MNKIVRSLVERAITEEFYGVQDDNFSDMTEEQKKEKLIQEPQHKFEVLKVSKEYKKEGPYRRIHIDLRNK